MTEELKQNTKEDLLRMPKEWQEVVNSFDWGTISEEIAKKYFLDEIAIENLQIEISLALTGAEEISYLKSNIENNVLTSRETAEKITIELFEKIFKPMTDKLTENIKNIIKDKKPTWDQNIDFIISGGDYSIFLRKDRIKNNLPDRPATEKTPINYSKLEDLKNNFTI